jgi:hypothetical protein
MTLDVQALDVGVAQPPKLLERPHLDKDANKKGKDKEDKDDGAKLEGDGFQHPSNTINIIFDGDSSFPSKRAQKLTLVRS